MDVSIKNILLLLGYRDRDCDRELTMTVTMTVTVADSQMPTENENMITPKRDTRRERRAEMIEACTHQCICTQHARYGFAYDFVQATG